LLIWLVADRHEKEGVRSLSSLRCCFDEDVESAAVRPRCRREVYEILQEAR
jgi:hypothetical protein